MSFYYEWVLNVISSFFYTYCDDLNPIFMPVVSKFLFLPQMSHWGATPMYAIACLELPSNVTHQIILFLTQHKARYISWYWGSKVWKKVKFLSCVWLFATPWTVAYQAPPSMGFSRQEYWSGLPFPSPGDLPDPRTGPGLQDCRQTLYCLRHHGSHLGWVNVVSVLTQLNF